MKKNQTNKTKNSYYIRYLETSIQKTKAEKYNLIHLQLFI